MRVRAFAFSRPSIKVKVTLATVTIFLISLWSLAFIVSRMLREDLQRQLGERQFSAVSILAEQINSELLNRKRILEYLARGILPSILRNPGVLQAKLDGRPALPELFNAGVIAVGQDGQVLSKSLGGNDLVDFKAPEGGQLAALLRAGQMPVGRPIMDMRLLLPVFTITVPIRNPGGEQIGALCGLTRLDNANFLDKIAQNHFGKSGGFLLVALRYRRIVTASNRARIMEVLPPRGKSPTIDRFIDGYEGSVIFRDARGVEVLTSTRNIPFADWQLALSMPTAEAFAPILALQRRMMLATFCLTLVMGGMTWWVISRQLDPLATARTLVARSSAAGASPSLPILRQDEIGDLIAGFNHLLETLKESEAGKAELAARNRQLQKAESLGLMAASIAHHFNNKLQSVMASLDMIGDLPSGMDPARPLRLAKQATENAAEVSSLLLVYLGQVSPNREPRFLSEICRERLPLIEKTLPIGVELEVDFPEQGPIILANADQIQRVLTSLVTNGCEALGRGGGRLRLEIGTCRAGEIPERHRYPVDWQPQVQDFALLAVQDSGGGIAEGDIEKLFDPFFSTKSVGRGLGLPVVLGLVQAHGGSITVASQQGKGSVFRVHFAVSTQAQLIPSRPAVRDSRLAGGSTVLMVDDDELLLESVGALIERLGFTLLIAHDGVEALEVFLRHQADICCVLTDLTMPRMNGLELLKALRQINPNLPVILASGYDQAQAMSGAPTDRPDAFLNKPFGLDQIREALGRSLRNG